MGINKADFKYFKPWLEESNLPKWAEDLQDKPIIETLGKDKVTKLAIKAMNSIDITPDQYAATGWKYNEMKG